MSDRTGARPPALLGMLLTAFALYLLSRVHRETSYAFLLIVMAILGVGIGTALPSLSRAVTGAVPLRQIGAATGIFNMVRNLGGPFGVAIAATLFAQRAADAARIYVIDRLATLGIDPQLVGDSPRLRELGPHLQTVREEAGLYAFQSAFTEVALVLLAISAIGVLATLAVGTPQRKVAWAPDALKLLGHFPSPLRARARNGLEKAAYGRGLYLYQSP